MKFCPKASLFGVAMLMLCLHHALTFLHQHHHLDHHGQAGTASPRGPRRQRCQPRGRSLPPLGQTRSEQVGNKGGDSAWGLSCHAPPRARLSPSRGRRIRCGLPRLAAHTDAPCPPRSDLDGSQLPGPRWPGLHQGAGPREASLAESVQDQPPRQLRAPEACHSLKVQRLHPRPLNPGVRGSRPQQKAAPAEEHGPALPKDRDPEGASRAQARPDVGRPAPTPTPRRRGPDMQRMRVCWASHRGRGSVQAWRQAQQGQGHRLQSLDLPTAVLMLARGVPGASQADTTERGVES